jgi:1-phosphofructokinase/6-phosphofructokinase 2
LPSILTVTPNPSLDLLFEARGLVFDDANRMAEPRRRPGGQGINTARAVQRLGGGAVAVALLGGAEGREIEDSLRAENTPVIAVPARQPTRLFIAVHDQGDGRNLLLNARGHERPADEAEALLEAAGAGIERHRPKWVVGAGSLPPGFPEDWYSRLARSARASACRVVIDCDTPALGLAAPHCDLLVPNRYEAGRLLGLGAVETVEQAAEAARAILGLGVSTAAVTLGPMGAELAHGGKVWHARAPETPGIAVGAGDVFLAGLLLSLLADDPPERSLEAAVAAASGALAARGTDIIDSRRAAAVLDAIRAQPVA